MTAVPITEPPGPAPSPAAVAAASHRLRASAATLRPVRVRLAPVRALPQRRESRPPADPVDDPGGLIERDRQRWADCSRGAHVWTETPQRVVCLHCPTPQDQAERVRAARRARLGRP